MLKSIQIVEFLNQDIEKLKNYYSRCNNNSKEQIREKWLFMELKKISIISDCWYLKKAYDMLKSEELYKVEEALEYLKRVDNKISAKNIVNKIIFKAILYELLLKYIDASIEYKKALKISFDKEIVKLYDDFIKRTKKRYKINEDKDLTKNEKENSYNNDIKELEKSAKSLEAIAKYYARSNSSLELAQDYFKQALEIYNQLMQQDSKYTRSYVLALIKAYETYKISKKYLDEAENLIFYSKECKDAEFYLLNKIKILKSK